VASTNTSTTAAKRYATALIDTAAKAQSIDSIEKDIHDLGAMLAASDDMQIFVTSPLIAQAEQAAAMAAIADKAGFNALTKNFLQTLIANRRLPMLAAALKAVQAEISKRRGEVEAQIQSAVALSPDQTKDLQAAISQALGMNVAMNVTVNKDLIGGLVVQVGSTLVDASVKNKIERLSRAMMRGTGKAA
jgi:F-type H+-transporting ATPase subunit delta